MFYPATPTNRPYFAIATLIDRHGAWTVLRAVAAALLRQNRRKSVSLDALPDHLRRDIGAAPHPPAPPLRPPPF